METAYWPIDSAGYRMACLSTAATGTQSPETGMKTGLNAPLNPS